jgi:hypothetical protein
MADNLPVDYIPEEEPPTDQDPYTDVSEAVTDLEELKGYIHRRIDDKSMNTLYGTITLQSIDHIISRLNLYLEQ